MDVLVAIKILEIRLKEVKSVIENKKKALEYNNYSAAMTQQTEVELEAAKIERVFYKFLLDLAHKERQRLT